MDLTIPISVGIGLLIWAFSGDDKKKTGGGGGKKTDGPPVDDGSKEYEAEKNSYDEGMALGEVEGCADGKSDGGSGAPHNPNPMAPSELDAFGVEGYNTSYMASYSLCYGPAKDAFDKAKSAYTVTAAEAEKRGRNEGYAAGAWDRTHEEPRNPNPDAPSYWSYEHRNIYNTNYTMAYNQGYDAATYGSADEDVGVTGVVRGHHRRR